MTYYNDHEWIPNPNYEELYCNTPECPNYHERVWRRFEYDADTGITDYTDSKRCDKCGYDMYDTPIDTYEILAENFGVYLYEAINKKDWNSEEYKIYRQILDLLDNRNQ